MIVACAIHHEREMRKELHLYYVCGASLPSGTSDCNTTKSKAASCQLIIETFSNRVVENVSKT